MEQTFLSSITARRCLVCIIMLSQFIGMYTERILSQPRNTTVKQGESADFTVTLDRAEIGSKVKWFKDTILVKENDRITYDEAARNNGQFTLRINPVIRSDKGYYKATYSMGETLLSTIKAYLNILEIPIERYPICVTWKHVYNIMDIVNVTCISENISPRPNLLFERRATTSEIISNETNIWISMEFRAVPNLDGQLYTCQQSGPKIQTKYCDIILNVTKILNVTILTEQNKRYNVGDVVKLACFGNYSKSAKYEWKLNQEKLEFTKSEIEVQINENGDKNVTCEIQEGLGTGSSSVILAVNQNTTTDRPPPGDQHYKTSTENSKTIKSLLCAILIILVIIFIILSINTFILWKIYVKYCKPNNRCINCLHQTSALLRRCGSNNDIQIDDSDPVHGEGVDSMHTAETSYMAATAEI